MFNYSKENFLIVSVVSLIIIGILVFLYSYKKQNNNKTIDNMYSPDDKYGMNNVNIMSLNNEEEEEYPGYENRVSEDNLSLHDDYIHTNFAPKFHNRLQNSGVYEINH